MAAFQNGSLRLFRVAGVDVMIHWSWIVLAVLEMQFRQPIFDSPLWSAALFLAAFAIVLLHEIGHVTSCRQVGGTADRIVLFPYAGVAVINPPPRPWPVFWSAAGGPLVNIALVPVTILAYFLCQSQGWTDNKDVNTFLLLVTTANVFLLLYNLLPLYPLDGGQMFYAVLWAIFGRVTALMIAGLVGMVGCIALTGLLLLAAVRGHMGLLILAFITLMMALRAGAAFAQARLLSRVMTGPRHRDASCPACNAHPLMGNHWVCDECRCRFDTFDTLAECPRCFKRFPETICSDCGRKNTIIAWFPRAGRPSQPATAATEPPFRPHEEWDQDMPREYS
jgi:Zn-dependent protease